MEAGGVREMNLRMISAAMYVITKLCLFMSKEHKMYKLNEFTILNEEILVSHEVRIN
jgi:hypothetical protein